MQIIRVSPPRAELLETLYSAEMDDLRTSGLSVGEAVAPILNALTERGIDFSQVRLLVFPRGGDDYFTDAQIARMQELIASRNRLRESGQEQTDSEREEVEQLINAELDGNARRMEDWLTGVSK